MQRPPISEVDPAVTTVWAVIIVITVLGWGLFLAFTYRLFN